MNNKKFQYIFHKDALSFMQILESESIDLIIADPPYFRIKGDFDFVFTGSSL